MPQFEDLVSQFKLIQKRYLEAETHDEKVQLMLVAKEIVREARSQIMEHKALREDSANRKLYHTLSQSPYSRARMPHITEPNS